MNILQSLELQSSVAVSEMCLWLSYSENLVQEPDALDYLGWPKKELHIQAW